MQTLDKDNDLNGMKFAAILLIAVGALGRAYGSFSVTKQTNEVKLGPIELLVRQRQTVKVRVWLGMGAVARGGALLFSGTKRR